MPSTPVRPLSHHLVINTHNLSQAHNRGSPRSANANANNSMPFKDSNRPSMEKRHSFGPGGQGSGGGPNGNSHSSPFHGHGPLGHGHSRPRLTRALTFLRILACAPGFFGLMYSLSMASNSKHFDFEQQQHQDREGSYQSAGEDTIDTTLMRSDFWIASMWCSLSMFWAYLLTTAIVQRLLQSYRPPNAALRVALAHLCSWIFIGTSVNSSPFTEPIRPWVYITLAQSVLLFVIVYLPWFRAQVQPAGFSKLSDRSPHHALDDGFMGREISGQSAARFIALPLMIVGLCSWMLIITRDHQNPSGGLIQDVSQPPAGQSFNNGTGTFLENIDRQVDNRMVISMIVLSSATPQGFVNRKMFRDTTLKLFPSPRNKAVIVKYRFIIGTTMPAVEEELQQEHKLSGDLLIVTAPDRGDSKSRKLYKAIEWANQFDFDYLVKTDDDVLVRMDALSGELYKQGKKEYFWKGLVFKNVPNTRLDDMDLKEMPAFTDGTLTTLSRDIVRLLSIPAPRYFVSSSAQSLGIWLHGYGIKPVHDTRIQPGAFVCEEDLIAKHFDNEPSLLVHPRDDPVKMVERINLIRGELKQNKGNRNFRTSISICDPLIQKRCAICYSCQGRASNWKQMGFDCKQGGVVVGDKYRKPELLNSKQMDELLNRPSSGILEELGPIYLKDYRPESRARQQMNREMQEEDPEEVTEEGEEEQEEEAPEEEESGEAPEMIMNLEDALEEPEVQEQQNPEQLLERSLGGRGEKSSRANLKASQKPKTSKKKPRHFVL